ncbi:halo transducer protein, partial [Halorubrum sp. SS5]
MIDPATRDVSVDRLVEVVTERTGEDPDSVRRSFDPVTDDGTVTAAAFESTVTDVSQILATAETRVDLATRAHEDATAAADDAPDLDVVEVRRRAFGARLDDLRAEVEALGDDLAAARADPESPMDVYHAAVDLHEVTTGAQDVVRVAHDLETELEAFEAWLSSANRRHDGLVDEVEAAEESAESLAETVAALRAAEAPDPERRFDASVQARVLDLVVADLRAEAEDLRAWAERDGVAFPDGVDARLDDLAAEATASAEALADGPEPDDRFAARLDTLDAELGAAERGG